MSRRFITTDSQSSVRPGRSWLARGQCEGRGAAAHPQAGETIASVRPCRSSSQPARIAPAVLRIRDGKVVHWREYQDTFAILQAMTQP
jgi:ketosteroid isomerase-like protein